ncbi:MAG: NGG1p interacting factor NIF3 [Gammaproteobacteria bacterium]|nr:NGG1p interacting factor NIF3 [Gammaproteobacteria bacterium]
MYQIYFYIPVDKAEAVKKAMFSAGAGKIGNYENCAWQTLGQGQFKPIKDANPTIGKLDKLEILEELKVEMLCTQENLKQAISAMKSAHPYEQVAYSILKMKES